MKIRISAKKESISKAIESLSEELKKIKNLSSKKLAITLMTTEDMIVEMIENSSDDSFM